MRGAWTAVRTILVPAAWKTASNEAVKFDPRSRIRNLMSSDRSLRPRARLRACCTVHSPVGFAVTPPMCIRRVPCSMNTSTYMRYSSTVSACRKSAATIPAAWARRNCRQPRARASQCRIDARRMQDLPHRRRRNCHAELGEFAMDPPVSPPGDSPSPGGRQGGRCRGSSVGVPACSACSCHISSPPACGARPAASLASRGRLRPSACAAHAAPARRTRPGQPARTAPGRRAAAVPRSHAGAPAAQHPSPVHRGIPGWPGRVPGTRAK
jgi:hypothetical protein